MSNCVILAKKCLSSKKTALLTLKWHYLWKNGKIYLHSIINKINLYSISKIGLTLKFLKNDKKRIS